TAFFGLNRIIEKERVSFTYTATKSGFLQDSLLQGRLFCSYFVHTKDKMMGKAGEGSCLLISCQDSPRFLLCIC
ncbi:hypothetical protein, partial [Brevibacillus brevis]|uniref:hypothetical protein n=1 Tax=Brevibacillus brevis TaxID=1393 RepID=UPI0037CAED53